MRARGRAGGTEHLLARHHHLDWPAGLLGQRQRDGLQIHDGLAAEAAADLCGRHADLADVPAEQPCAVGAHDPMALRRHPQLRLSVLGHGGYAGVRLDVALVHRLGRERALYDEVRLLEAGLDVADSELDALGDVGGLLGRRLHAGRYEVLVQQRRVRLHSLDDVDDVRQHLVIDFDQLQGLLGDGGAGGGHRRHRMALEEDLLARHHATHDVAVIDHHLAGRNEFGRLILEVVARHHGLDAGQLQSR
jgi:hypothetical protein